ncbi:hypothetical protein, partial [Sutterella sp.]|uniref:hypothetical protein n=1 Tax=Sutterella sp. TaxID=1981025 RepID=UPI003FD86E5F
FMIAPWFLILSYFSTYQDKEQAFPRKKQIIRAGAQQAIRACYASALGLASSRISRMRILSHGCVLQTI